MLHETIHESGGILIILGHAVIPVAVSLLLERVDADILPVVFLAVSLKVNQIGGKLSTKSLAIFAEFDIV